MAASRASARHTWDGPSLAAAAGSAPHAWDTPPANDDPDDNDSEVEDTRTPAEMFIEIMIMLLIMRNLNAREFCTLMFWAGRAGVAGASDYGLNPDLPSDQSGHYNRKCEQQIPLFQKRDRLYSIKYPWARKSKRSSKHLEPCMYKSI